MSEQETWKGRFMSTGLTLEEFVDKHEDKVPDYCKEADSRDKFYEIVFKLTSEEGSTSKDFFVKNNIVYEVTELIDLNYSSFMEIDEVYGTFVTSFHNGGTCLSEMLEEA